MVVNRRLGVKTTDTAAMKTMGIVAMKTRDTVAMKTTATAHGNCDWLRD